MELRFGSLATSPWGAASLRSPLTTAQSVPARAPTTWPGRREAPSGQVALRVVKFVKQMVTAMESLLMSK
jgi:hypothetical protein